MKLIMAGSPLTTGRRRFIAGGVAGLFVGIAGCIGDDDPADNGVTVADEEFDDFGIDEFELLDRGHDPHEEVAYVHGDHWHGGLPTIDVEETLSVGAHIHDEDGDHVDLGDGLEVQVHQAPGASDGILSLDNHGDHVHLTGEEVGITEVVFLLVEDGTAVYQTPPITAQVSEGHDHDEFDAHHVSEVRIYDRAPDPHEEVADWHDDHWHGTIPPIPLDDNISLGASFVDADGNEAELSGEYELRVSLAEGADDIVSFDFHGDHVHIIGEVEGTTAVVFELWHDDHADFTTTPIEAEVADN